MSERRSSRAKKVVKYSSFGDQSDDDFADSTPPPPKKTKSSTKKESDKKPDTAVCQTIADVSTTDSSRKRRIPLSEKVYERELQQALEMSLIQSQGDDDDQGAKDFKEADGTVNAASKTAPNKDGSPKLSYSKNLHGVVVDEEIEILTEDNRTSTSRPLRGETKQEANKKQTDEKQDKDKEQLTDRLQKAETDPKIKNKKLTKDESDYESEDEEEESENSMTEDADDDSDFGDSKPTKRKAPAKKQPKNVTENKVHTAKPFAKPPVRASANKAHDQQAPSKVSATKKHIAAPSRATAKSAPCSIPPSWKPPTFSSSNVSTNSAISTVKSPSSGLRLGLSRNQRVKPLHPSVKVT